MFVSFQAFLGWNPEVHLILGSRRRQRVQHFPHIFYILSCIQVQWYPLLQQPHSDFMDFLNGVWIVQKISMVERNPDTGLLTQQSSRGERYPNLLETVLSLSKDMVMHCQKHPICKMNNEMQYQSDCVHRWHGKSLGFYCKVLRNKHPWTQCCPWGRNIQPDSASLNSYACSPLDFLTKSQPRRQHMPLNSDRSTTNLNAELQNSM